MMGQYTLIPQRGNRGKTEQVRGESRWVDYEIHVAAEDEVIRRRDHHEL